MPAEFGPSLLVRRLEAALRDIQSSKVHIRRAAARDLSQYVDSPARARTVDRLERLVVEDADIEVRAEGVLALADGGATESVGLLIGLARTGVPRIRQIALLAIGELAETGVEDAIEVALEAVESPLPGLRYQGLVTLKNLQQAEALGLIISKTADADSEVRWVAVRLIDELCLQGSSQGSAPTVFGAWDAANIRKLQPLLEDQDRRVVVAATLLLSRLRVATAIDKLATLLSKSSYKLEPQDEETAIEMIGQLRLSQAKPELERRAWRLLWEGPTTWPARVALGQLGDRRARQSILQSLYSNSPLKCARAIEAAGKIGLEEGRARLQYLLANPSGYDVETIRTALERLDSSK
jgi:HEAT repeat protein